MKNFVPRLVALALLVFTLPMLAHAGADFVPYKTGIVKSAIAKGETALLFFKSTY
ncbi:MAG: hypothetical protein CFH08_01055 [Alphaproteobacteria bacterium MarineAlpha3_Bin7]|nr:MAG: hypothetical protein CFH08_01055 [Alphaproteobacteria bacterium MarineAlpha3_Bin7]